MSILMIDNYDSFTYNLVHLIRELTTDPVAVFRNDQIGLEAINRYQKIILSPGPGLPGEAGILKSLIQTYAPSKSILGVCLGHQAIAEVFGATLLHLPKVYHGVTGEIEVIDPSEKLFSGLPTPFTAGRYHSWVVGRPMPETLIVTATDRDGTVMALRHSAYDVRGVQFHPESILTPFGKQILSNWLAD